MNKLGRKLRELGMSYAQYLQSDHWKAFRKRFYQRYGCRCSICGSCDNINLHHKTYNRLGKEWLTDAIALCRDHHHEFHAACGNAFIWQNTKNFIKMKKVEVSGGSQKVVAKAQRRLNRKLADQMAFLEKQRAKKEAKMRRRAERQNAGQALLGYDGA